MDTDDKITAGKHLVGFFKKSAPHIYKFFIILITIGLGTPLLFESALLPLAKLGILVVGTIIVVFLMDLIEKKEREKLRTELDPQYEITFSNISMGLETILAGALQREDCSKIEIEKILLYIQASVISILNENKIAIGDICVNLMICEHDKLKLTHFDMFRQDRKYVSLDITSKIPGAPKAYKTGETQYIADTEALGLRKYFKRKPYKSIISFPLTIRSDATQENLTYGVVNLDSTIANQFVSMKFIEKKLESPLNPLLSILHILYKTGKIVRTE